MDDLNKWLDKVERQIAQQDVLSEDFDALRSQIQAMKVGNIISGSIGMASRFLYIYICCFAVWMAVVRDTSKKLRVFPYASLSYFS